MLKILWKRGKIAPEKQFLPLSTIFYYLMLDFYVKTGIRFSVRDKRLFEITEVEITRVDCIRKMLLMKDRSFLHELRVRLVQSCEKITIHHECPCRIGKSEACRVRGLNSNPEVRFTYPTRTAS